MRFETLSFQALIYAHVIRLRTQRNGYQISFRFILSDIAETAALYFPS